MADRFPLILNTSNNQIQEIASGDNLDLTGTGISNAGIITAGNVTIGAGTTDLIVTGDARITGILTVGTGSITLNETANTINVGTALTLGHTQGLQFHTQNLHSAGFEVNQINASGITTIGGKLDTNGVIEAIAGENKIPFLYADLASLPSASTYHGMFAHVHATGRGYYAHGGAWYELVNKDTNGNVALNKDLDVDGHTNLDNISVAGVSTFTGNSDFSAGIDVTGNATVSGNLSVGGVLTYEDVTNIDSVGIITARSDIKVGSAITLTSAGAGFYAGIVTASSFKLADGSNVGGVESDAQFNTVGGTNAGGNFSGTNPVNNTLFGYNSGANITTSDKNTAFGYNTLATGNSTGNTAMGWEALKNASGSSGDAASLNVAIGTWSLKSLTTGYDNVAVGYYSAIGLQSAHTNVIIGKNTGGGITNNGNYNVAVGSFALAGGDASQNVAIGYQSLKDAATNCIRNTGVGMLSGENITTGAANTLIGFKAGDQLTTGSNNLLLGNESAASSATVSNEITLGNTSITKFRIPGINVTLKDNGGTPTQGHVLTVDGSGEASFVAGGVTSDAQYNTVGGTNAGNSFNGTNAEQNTLFGYNAGDTISTGDRNTVVGNDAAGNLNTGYRNTALGDNAQVGSSGNYNVTLGAVSGSSALTGSYNIAAGYKSGYQITSGEKNIAIGYEAAEQLTTGSENIAIGVKAMSNATVTGSNNIALGQEALKQNTSAANNIAIGQGAGTNITTSLKNVIIGKSAGNGLQTGYGNNIILGERSMFSCGSDVNNLIAIGYEALKSHQGSTNSIAIGTDALETSTTGRNIGIGRDAGVNVSDGSQNTILGYRAGDILTSGDNNIIIGDDADPSSATTDNEITLGNTSITRFRIPGLGLDFNGNNLDLGDSKKIRLGTGNDLEIYHSGSHSIILENGTGNLQIAASTIQLTNSAINENMIVATADAGVEMYFNNVKKFESTVRGVEISGNATNPLTSLSDGSTITVDFGASCNFTVTLGGNRTFGDPDNLNSSVGSSGSIFIVQDGTGSRTASFHADYKFPGGTAPTLSTAANAVDRLDYIVRANNNVHCVLTLDVK